jgi:hypothetical protein
MRRNIDAVRLGPRAARGAQRFGAAGHGSGNRLFDTLVASALRR